MSSNMKRGVDADAASSATKRASLGSDPSPPPTDVKNFEMPVFNIKEFIPFTWRDMIPSGDDGLVEGFVFSTQDPHMRRVFDFALNVHQSAKCSGKSGKLEAGPKAVCAFCLATAGTDFSYKHKGDHSKKIIPLSLYAEVMKTYVPFYDDYVAGFPAKADFGVGDTELTQLDVTSYFFDGSIPMWYCSKSYPNLPKAVQEMDAFQKYQLQYDKTRAEDLDYNQQRRMAVAQLNELKATQKAEFCRLLKQISISSRLDLTLHNLSVIQRDKPKALPRLSDAPDTVSEFVKVMKPHIDYVSTKKGNGNTQLVEDVIECLRKDPVFTAATASIETLTNSVQAIRDSLTALDEEIRKRCQVCVTNPSCASK